VAGVVGMIPEGLVLLTSLNFALAVIRLARKNTLVQQLESVETLARVDCLNLDKTGTITDGGIAFDSLTPLAGEPGAISQALFDVLNEQSPNATGAAVIAALKERGVEEGAVTACVPFSSVRKWSAAVTSDGRAWYCGAPEILLSALTAPYPDVRAQVSKDAEQGNRVLLLARGRRPSSADFESEELPNDLEPAAIVTCSESIRPDAAQTLAYFREQGVRCRIISGDNPQTVGAIARKVDLLGQGRAPRAVDARDLPNDPVALAAALEDIDVLGRVLPEQKKAIVDALHLSSHVVAMTGDGVNDSLAIKEADLGIAMGNAAAATKSVAQVVLVDSKFSHLPDVVSQGRRVMANMERVASLFLVKTCYSALISLGVVVSAIPFPYLPRHMTYISALTIGIPAFILSLAPNNQRYKKGFLSRVVLFSIPSGVAIGICVLLVSWLLPRVAGWNVFDNHTQLMTLRTCCAIVVFTMGILVLARVSKPLMSWRGGLVAFVAIVGVAGAFIPFVARFFAIDLPDDIAGWHLGVELAASVVLFFLLQELARYCVRILRRRLVKSSHEIQRL
jgi:cation-transporting ATPase E